MTLIDLSHSFEDGMPGFRLEDENGTETEYTAEIHPLFTHEESRSKYEGEAAFEVTEIQFQTSVGTYLDAPYHRYPDGRDISELEIDELVLPGIVVDARGLAPGEQLTEAALPPEASLAGKAVLFDFGWSQYWGSEKYRSYPYLSESVIETLIEANVALVGVDTINIDDHRDPARPAHSQLLAEEILIVENLRNLTQLPESGFRLFAVPIKAVETAAMPVRAFAEVSEN
ncbi:cyclase family protein [Halorubrum tropicale]|uniref:Cyclase n=1 Tax=Halorubrum tropicale TaxID=1765655 RepID=A0A0M9AQN0_9EURY|nr:cyclase family protein [Halorubrum tropicale]KOX95491.1 cyclase [Halorubrum tropicale]